MNMPMLMRASSSSCRRCHCRCHRRRVSSRRNCFLCRRQCWWQRREHGRQRCGWRRGCWRGRHSAVTAGRSVPVSWHAGYHCTEGHDCRVRTSPITCCWRHLSAVVVVTSSCRGGGVIGRFKGFVNAFQFSNLGIDLGKINEAVFSPSDVAATVADAASGSNGWGTAAINLAAEASVPAKFYMPYVACLAAAAIAVVVAAELVCWCLAASCGCCVAKRARGIPGPSGGIALRSMTPSSTASVAGAPKSGGSHEEPREEAGGASRKQVHGAQSKRNSIRWLRFKVRRELSVVPLCRSVSWAVLANVGER